MYSAFKNNKFDNKAKSELIRKSIVYDDDSCKRIRPCGLSMLLV